MCGPFQPDSWVCFKTTLSSLNGSSSPYRHPMFNPQDNPEGFLGILAGIGALIGLGKLLGSTEALTPRILAGRMLASAGVGCAAGATTLIFPAADPMVLLGVAAALASAGFSAIEMILKKKMGDQP